MGSMSHFFGQCLLVLFWIDDYNSLDLPLNSHNLQQSVRGITVFNVGLKIRTWWHDQMTLFCCWPQMLLYCAKLFSLCHLESLNVSSLVLLKHVWPDHQQTSICFLWNCAVIGQNVLAWPRKRHCIMQIQFSCLFVTCFIRLEVLALVMLWMFHLQPFRTVGLLSW